MIHSNYTSIVCLLIWGCFMVFTACKKPLGDLENLDLIEWNPHLAVPLVSATFDVYDLIANAERSDVIVIDPQTGLVALVYEGQVASFDMGLVFKVPGSQFDYEFTASPVQFNDLVGGITVSAPFALSHNFIPDDEDILIQEIKIESGKMILGGHNEFPINAATTITLPGVTSNGSPMSINFQFQPNQPIVADNVIDLAGYTIMLGPQNQLAITGNFTLSPQGNMSLNGTETIDLSIEFDDIVFEHIIGHLGQRQILFEKDSVEIEVFRRFTEGVFEFYDPRVKFTINNSFGLPVSVQIHELYTLNQNNTLSEFLLATFPNPFTIESPSQLGQTATTEIFLNKTNSNIAQVTSNKPKMLYFEVEAETNPPGAGGGFNFVTKDSRVDLDVAVELPLEGFAYNFFDSDTAAFTFTEDTREIDWVRFRFILTNGFPIDIDAQIYLADADYNILDTLLLAGSQSVLPSAPTNADGRVTAPVQNVVDIDMERERARVLYETKYVIVRVDAETLNATNSPPHIVRMYEDYTIAVKLGMEVKFKMVF